MINDYWIVNALGMQYGFRIIKAFRIFAGKGIVNDYWIVYMFEIVSVFRM